MLPLLLACVIAFVAAALYVFVDKFEPNRRYAMWLKMLVVVVATIAIARQLLP